MKEQIDLLIKLQAIENKIKNMRRLLKEVPGKLNLLDEALVSNEQKLEEKSNQLDDLRKKYRVLDDDSQQNISMRKKSEGKLISVKTNKEYQAILKEIEELKGLNSSIEDKMLEILDKIEVLERKISEYSDEFKEKSIHIKEEKKMVQEVFEEDQKSLSLLEEERSQFVKEIEPDLLERYIFVKKQNSNGVAITRAKDAVCQCCNINIPPQMYNELHRTDSLKYCPNCQRIIYWREDNL